MRDVLRRTLFRNTPLKMVLVWVAIVVMSAGEGCSLLSSSAVSSGNSVNSQRFQRGMEKVDVDLRKGHLDDALHLVTVWGKYPYLTSAQKARLSRKTGMVHQAFALYLVGQATQLEKLGRNHEALRQIEKARGFEPGWDSLKNEEKRIRIRMTVKDAMGPSWKSLIRRLMVLKTKDPSDPDLDQTLSWAWANLSEAQYSGGHYRQAREAAREALAYDSRNAKAIRVSHTITQMLDDWIHQGERRFRQNDLPGSIRLFRAALKIDPGQVRAQKDLELAQEAESTGSTPTSPKAQE